MRPLSQRIEPPLRAKPQPDPSPSIWAYRLHRLRLSRRFQTFLRLGLPLGLMLALVSWVWLDDGRRAAVIATYNEAVRSVAQRPEFAVRMLAIDGASARLATEVRAALALDLPMSSFDLDLDALRDRVELLTPVAQARLSLRAGSVLHVDIRERQPLALWFTPANELWTLDASGHPVRQVPDRSSYPDLPLLSGSGVDQALSEGLSVIAAARPLQDRVVGLVRRGERRWDIVLAGGQVIRLPEAAAGHSPVQALERLIARDKVQDLFERDIAIFDMRLPDRPTLRLTEAATEDLRRIRLLETGAATR